MSMNQKPPTSGNAAKTNNCHQLNQTSRSYYSKTSINTTPNTYSDANIVSSHNTYVPGSQHVNVGSNSNIRSFNNKMNGSRVPGELATEKSNNSSGVNVSKNVSNYKNPYPHFSNQNHSVNSSLNVNRNANQPKTSTQSQLQQPESSSTNQDNNKDISNKNNSTTHHKMEMINQQKGRKMIERKSPTYQRLNNTTTTANNNNSIINSHDNDNNETVYKFGHSIKSSILYRQAEAQKQRDRQKEKESDKSGSIISSIQPKYLIQNSKYISSPQQITQFSQFSSVELQSTNKKQNKKTIPHLELQSVQRQRGKNNSVVSESSSKEKNKLKQINSQSADYYKYWKTKANQYQQQNFNLHRINSGLQQELQILKHKLEKIEKKFTVISSNGTPKNLNQNSFGSNSNLHISNFQLNAKDNSVNSKSNQINYQKLQNYYRAKIDQMSRKISQQELLIKKQDKKIRQLSNYIAENYQLKNILDNMEEKFSQMRSMGSKDSRTNSADKNSQQNPDLGFKTIYQNYQLQIRDMQKQMSQKDKEKGKAKQVSKQKDRVEETTERQRPQKTGHLKNKIMSYQEPSLNKAQYMIKQQNKSIDSNFYSVGSIKSNKNAQNKSVQGLGAGSRPGSYRGY